MEKEEKGAEKANGSISAPGRAEAEVAGAGEELLVTLGTKWIVQAFLSSRGAILGAPLLHHSPPMSRAVPRDVASKDWGEREQREESSERD